MEAELTAYRCPRCGSPVIGNDKRLWCTFVGGGREAACTFGIDEPVTRASFPESEKALDEMEEALFGNI